MVAGVGHQYRGGIACGRLYGGRGVREGFGLMMLLPMDGRNTGFVRLCLRALPAMSRHIISSMRFSILVLVAGVGLEPTWSGL